MVIQKKVCMIGAFAVGKTSLVARFVKSIYSDVYKTTVGVKIDKKTVSTDDRDINLILWDLHGEDEFQKIRATYLRGSSGCLLVADGTRRETLDKALELKASIESLLGRLPFVLALNKCDLREEWELGEGIVEACAAQGLPVLETSAKDGTGVEDAFMALARKMSET